MREADDGDTVHTCSRRRVFTKELEAGEVDEHVREQVGTLEEDAGKLRHDFAGAFDTRS
jgi:hypothetical protein